MALSNILNPKYLEGDILKLSDIGISHSGFLEKILLSQFPYDKVDYLILNQDPIFNFYEYFLQKGMTFFRYDHTYNKNSVIYKYDGFLYVEPYEDLELYAGNKLIKSYKKGKIYERIFFPSLISYFNGTIKFSSENFSFVCFYFRYNDYLHSSINSGSYYYKNIAYGCLSDNKLKAKNVIISAFRNHKRRQKEKIRYLMDVTFEIKYAPYFGKERRRERKLLRKEIDNLQSQTAIK